MTDLSETKRLAREAALARRAEAFARSHHDPAGFLARELVQHRGKPVAAYVAMRTEIDPLPALRGWDAPLGLPIVEAKGRPLRFRAWEPGAPLVSGGFGTLVPEAGAWVEPLVLVVPLVAFDRRGGRLGYGGGFYDRTLAGLRERGPVTAIGFAWAAQEDAGLPLEPTDAPLDLVVTEAEVIRPLG